MEFKSEAKLTTFEAICMIVGNSIGTGIIAVPYLATKNSMLDVVWMVALAYIINVIPVSIYCSCGCRREEITEGHSIQPEKIVTKVKLTVDRRHNFSPQY